MTATSPCGSRPAPTAWCSARGHWPEPWRRPIASWACTENTHAKGIEMKIVVIGGTGLIGSSLVDKLREQGHDALAAAPNTGVNTLTGEGLAEALEGPQVVVDGANAPAWEDQAVLDFFQTSSRNLLAAEAAAGVGHHVTLSVVGAERLPDSGYLRAKLAQEELVKAGPIPYTIVRATQFFEFIGRIADSSTDGDTVRLSPALVQPVAADVHARYFGAELDDRSLTPGEAARIAPTRFEDWLSQSANQT